MYFSRKQGLVYMRNADEMFHAANVYYAAVAYSEPCQTSKMERFVKIVNG